MALPTVEKQALEDMQAVIAEEQAKETLAVATGEAFREAAPEAAVIEGEVISSAAEEVPVTAAVEVASPVASTEVAVVTTATVQPAAGTPASLNQNPDAFLEAAGIDTSLFKVDFASFPIVTLKDSSFSSPEVPNMGESFECFYMHHRESFICKGLAPTRNDEDIVAYSDDKVFINGGDKEDEHGNPIRKTVDEFRAEMHAQGREFEMKPYIMVECMINGGDMDQELVQLQVSPASQTKLWGYLKSLGMRSLNPKKVITEVYVSAEVGKGQRAFHPWGFRLSKNNPRSA